MGMLTTGFTFLIFLLATGMVQSQPTNQNYVSVGGQPFLILDDMTARVSDFVDRNRDKLNPEKVSGSLFLTDEWNKGYIKLPDGRVANELQLKYDVYTNSIHFLKDSTELVLTIPVREFGFFNKADSTAQIFRNGYPATGKLDSLSYYQVLADGTVTLLKKHLNLLRQITPVSGITTYRLEAVSKLYLFYGAKSRLRPIKNNQHDILSAIPAVLQEKFKVILSEKKYNLKREKDITALINRLNAR